MTISIHHSVCNASGHAKPRTLWEKFGDMLAINRQRSQLRDLDDHLLDDIGVTRREAINESRQSLWNAPTHWRK